jgi:hypothetical protein
MHRKGWIYRERVYVGNEQEEREELQEIKKGREQVMKIEAMCYELLKVRYHI